MSIQSSGKNEIRVDGSEKLRPESPKTLYHSGPKSSGAGKVGVGLTT